MKLQQVLSLLIEYLTINTIMVLLAWYYDLSSGIVVMFIAAYVIRDVFAIICGKNNI